MNTLANRALEILSVIEPDPTKLLFLSLTDTGLLCHVFVVKTVQYHDTSSTARLWKK